MVYCRYAMGGAMNNIHSCVDEIILTEVVYE